MLEWLFSSSLTYFKIGKLYGRSVLYTIPSAYLKKCVQIIIFDS